MPTTVNPFAEPGKRLRVLGALVATLMGRSAIVGTRVFVSIGIALPAAVALSSTQFDARHPIVATCGLVACLGLAFFVEVHIWLLGLGLIAAGLVWHALARRLTRRSE